jgi:RHS repeat-associated protein
LKLNNLKGGTDKLFTGQRKDGTSLYYYGARYYDPMIGRFVSADTVVPNPMNPQAFNRYTYSLNNPLKYVDPSGHQYEWEDYWYESSCAEAGVDPSAGYILVYEAGSWVSIGTTVENFVSWIDDTPDPYDYISEVNIDMNSPFSVWEVPLPKASGQVGIKGSATWTGNDVRVDVEVTIQRNYIAAGEVVGVDSAKISISPGRDTWFSLNEPEGTYIVPVGYSSVSGEKAIFDVPRQADIALEVGLYAYNRNRTDADPSFSRVEPWSWIIDLRTGYVRRNNNPWR